MPRVLTKKKSKAGKPYTCTKCNKPIKAGEEYHEWSFFRSSTHRQHTTCGYPKPSQLTQSKLSSVYAAIEDATETISKADDPEEIASAMESVAEEARNIASEYEEAMEAMGAAGEGGQNEERKDALESFADELESELEDIRSAEMDADDDEDEAASTGCRDSDTGRHVRDGKTCKHCGKAMTDEDDKAEEAQREKREEWLAELRDKASDALGTLEV